MAAQLRACPCPRCTQPLAEKKAGPRTWTQMMWGGWTCPDCGCDVDRFGNERPMSAPSYNPGMSTTNQNELPSPNAEAGDGRAVARRIVLGVIWTVILYFGSCMVVGGIAGAIATARMDPGQDPSVVGFQAGRAAVLALRSLIALSAIAIAWTGAYLRLLPGTRAKKRPTPPATHV